MGPTKTVTTSELGQADSRVVGYDARWVLFLNFAEQTFDAQRTSFGQTCQRPGSQPDVFAGEKPPDVIVVDLAG